VSARQDTAVAPRAPSTLARTLEENGLVVVAVAAFALVMLVELRKGLLVDGWLALAAGREIAQHGLPSHDVLTVWAHVRRWVDQQWLGQLALYGLVRLGGIKLALIVHAACGAGAMALAAVAARKLGGSPRSTTWVCLPVMIAVYPVASVMRTQSFAFPLFVAVLWLVAADSRAPSPRVFATLPILALWANVHGSVVLGAGLVSLAGLVGIAEGLLARPRRLRPRALALAVAPWPCLLVSPYALHLPGYYEKILVGSNFGQYVSEWAPTTLKYDTAAVYLLVIGGAWLVGRAGGRISTFEKLALLAMSLVAFQAVRNTAWIGLTALVVLPGMLDAFRQPAEEPRRLNRLLATAMACSVGVVTAAVAVNPTSWFTGGFPAAAARTAASGAGAHGKVIASTPYADWLLWAEPQLRGRVAFDARYELLSNRQLGRIGAFEGRVGDWLTELDGYRVVVIGARSDQALAQALVSSRRARVIHRDAAVVVLRLR
jgi:hypothetical protein